ncbi:hypothetical protein [Nostoc sp.]
MNKGNGEVYSEGLASSPWQHLDQTGARVAGVNHTTNVICNPLYTVYLTTRNKDRLSVLRVLQNTTELEFTLNSFTKKGRGQRAEGFYERSTNKNFSCGSKAH